MTEPLRIIPLGGVGEVGKNITLIEAAGRILVVDCGLAFPEPEMLGIDLVIPDVTYLEANRDRVIAIALTHGHEDHTGALPFVLPKLPGVPVYAGRLTSGLVRGKLKEHRLLDQTPLEPLEAGVECQIGPFNILPFRVNHSIPDGMGFAIRTESGTVVHTGDFKFDHTPPDGTRADLGLIAEIGNRGVDFLLSDSTRSEKEGYTLSEATVGESLHQLVGEAAGRVIVATFASNIGRVQQVLDAAAAHGRKMVALGRSMEQNIAIAVELGYLDPRGDTLARKDQLQRLANEELVVMTTGSQGEPMSGLTRMSNRDHRNITIEPGDTVIVSASPIPGNEEAVARTIDNLFKEGAMVHYEPLKHCHVSGHGSREELKLMLGLVKPRHFIPVHGEYRMLVQHGTAGRGCRRADRQHLRAGERAGGRVRRLPRAAGRQRAGRRGAGRRHRLDRRHRRRRAARPAHARLRRRGDGRADRRPRQRTGRVRPGPGRPRLPARSGRPDHGRGARPPGRRAQPAGAGHGSRRRVRLPRRPRSATPWPASSSSAPSGGR